VKPWSERMVASLRARATIGDGKTLCCSVDAIAELLQTCEQFAANEARLDLLEALVGKLTPEGLEVARHALEATKRASQCVQAEMLAERAKRLGTLS
jgi:hypothetical protein